MKKSLFILYIFSCFNLFGQNTLGTLLQTDNSLDGYVLFSPRTISNDKFTYLINDCGEILNSWPSTFSLFSTDYLLTDGSLMRSVVDNQSTLNIPGNTGRIEHLDWNGNLIWALTYSDIDFSFHHDFVPLENGNILMLVAHRRTQAEALENGRDPALMSVDELYEEYVIELEPIGTNGFNIVWEWRSWDHLIQDFDDTKLNYGIVSDHPELININAGTSVGEADWWHSNALSYNPERDNILISNRNFDEFIVIDHSTTTTEASSNSGGNSNKGGDILYRWGNPKTYNQGDENDQILYGQHDVQFIQPGLPNAGKIMIFNNGNDLTFTSILIIDPDYDDSTNNYVYTGGAYGPITSEWQYTDPEDPDNFHAPFLSGAQQLENGNVLICDGPLGNIFEIDTNFNKVWDYQSPVSNSGILEDGSDPDVEQTRIFRAVKYASDYEAFIGKDLTPQGVIEINPSDFDCNLLSISNFDVTNLRILEKNIIDNTLSISTKINFPFKYEVIDITGKRIINIKNRHDFNIDFLKSGIYFIKLTDIQTNSIYAERFIKK